MKHHCIDYIEFSAPDLEAIKRFYTSVFGWKFTDFGPNYSSFNDGTLDGGFEKGNVKCGGPLVVLYSKDLQESLTTIEEAGGKITKDIFSFPGGKRFHFTDPAGNELAVWSEK